MKIRHLVEVGKTNPKRTQTNPIKPNFKKAKMNVTSIITKGYENKPHFRAKVKQTQYEPKQSRFQIVEELLALQSIVATITGLE